MSLSLLPSHSRLIARSEPLPRLLLNDSSSASNSQARMSLMGRQRYDRSDGCRAARGQYRPVTEVGLGRMALT